MPELDYEFLQFCDTAHKPSVRHTEYAGFTVLIAVIVTCNCLKLLM